jgi:hypothetical protein
MNVQAACTIDIPSFNAIGNYFLKTAIWEAWIVSVLK